MSENVKITLATLHEASPQEIFDQVAYHLIHQGKSSVDSSGSCCYRGDDNLKCAAGCLISDEEYLDRFEGKQWHELSVDLELSAAIPHDLIQDLQYIHDEVDPKYWENHLRDLAEANNLDTNSIQLSH